MSALEGVFTENAIENTTFKHSISKGRCELLIIVKSTEHFIESELQTLCHLVIAAQAMFLKELECSVTLLIIII
jgi:hypothetical protein